MEKDTEEKEIFRNTNEEWHTVTKGVELNNSKTDQVQQHAHHNIHDALWDYNVSSEDKDESELEPKL